MSSLFNNIESEKDKLNLAGLTIIDDEAWRQSEMIIEEGYADWGSISARYKNTKSRWDIPMNSILEATRFKLVGATEHQLNVIRISEDKRKLY